MDAVTCHQYRMRQENLEKDLKDLGGISPPKSASEFEMFSLKEKHVVSFSEVRRFIESQEWLGNVPSRVSHTFVALWRGRLAGAVLMTSPHQHSKILDLPNSEKLERLIARGACISWSPKNLASRLIGHSLRWMVQNTPYRVFTAYCDPEAGELGSIYQACNAKYLGNTFGASRSYCIPEKEPKEWFSSRRFTTLHTTKKVAQEWGVFWNPEWNDQTTILWDRIPSETQENIKTALLLHKESAVGVNRALKHKYAWILGKNKKETGDLTKKILVPLLPYPKVRGDMKKY